jgi:hypothetical protein
LSSIDAGRCGQHPNNSPVNQAAVPWSSPLKLFGSGYLAANFRTGSELKPLNPGVPIPGRFKFFTFLTFYRQQLSCGRQVNITITPRYTRAAWFFRPSVPKPELAAR